MLIKCDVLEKIRTGEITLQFRRWARRTVKPGGTLKTAVGLLGIGAITRTEPGDVTDADARRAGFGDAAEFRKWLRTMKSGELDRIEVSYVGEDPRIALRQNDALAAVELEAITAKLAAMDRRTPEGPWTAKAMELIDQFPGRPAKELAREAGQDKMSFKAHVRKLKTLGLTESLEVGYRLSPRGRRVLAYRREAP